MGGAAREAGLALCLLCAVSVALAPVGHASGAHPDDPPDTGWRPDGRVVFQKYCRCHEPGGPNSLVGRDPEWIARVLHKRKSRSMAGLKRVKVAELSWAEIEAVSNYAAHPEGWDGGTNATKRSAP